MTPTSVLGFGSRNDPDVVVRSRSAAETAPLRSRRPSPTTRSGSLRADASPRPGNGLQVPCPTGTPSIPPWTISATPRSARSTTRCVRTHSPTAHSAQAVSNTPLEPNRIPGLLDLLTPAFVAQTLHDVAQQHRRVAADETFLTKYGRDHLGESILVVQHRSSGLCARFHLPDGEFRVGDV